MAHIEYSVMQATCTARVASDLEYKNLKSYLLDSLSSRVLSFQLASMLFLLTFVYVFYSFQTHAAPLNSILEESSSCNATFSMITPTLAVTCPADQRTILYHFIQFVSHASRALKNRRNVTMVTVILAK